MRRAPRDEADVVDSKQGVAASGSQTINAAQDIPIALRVLRMPNQVAVVTQIEAEFSVRRYLNRSLFGKIETEVQCLQKDIPFISESLLEEIAELHVEVEASVVERRKS